MVLSHESIFAKNLEYGTKKVKKSVSLNNFNFNQIMICITFTQHLEEKIYFLFFCFTETLCVTYIFCDSLLLKQNWATPENFVCFSVTFDH